MRALELAKQLVAFDSTSVLSNVAVTDAVEQLLHERGFVTERIDYTDERGVPKSNVIGKKGSGSPGLAYFAHTDVVPALRWHVPQPGPFEPTVREDRLYGRGSCDMKGSIAAMLTAIDRIPAERLSKSLYVTCTGDEEVGFLGAAQVRERSQLFRELVAADCAGIIGEPTRLEVVYAHKGTSGFSAISHGKAAHSSTNLGKNANLAMIPFLVEMKAIHNELESDSRWRHAEFDPPTMSWNIGINDHNPAVNVTAAQSICTVYFRPMPGQNAEELLSRARQVAERCGLEFKHRAGGPPVYTDPQSPFVREVLELAGRPQAKTVAYCTDGAMFTELRKLVVLGPGDIAQAHTHDEWISLEQLSQGADLYARLIEHWCC